MPAIWIIRFGQSGSRSNRPTISEHRHPRHDLVPIQRAFLLRLAARLRRSVLLDLDADLLLPDCSAAQGLLGLPHLVLAFPQCSVESILRKKCGMRAAFHDPAFVEHNDSSASTMVESLCAITSAVPPFAQDRARSDFTFGEGVQRRGCLVENKNRRRLRIVRAIATRCFSPPESFRPRSPTCAS